MIARYVKDRHMKKINLLLSVSTTRRPSRNEDYNNSIAFVSSLRDCRWKTGKVEKNVRKLDLS